jgi:hypothetical protein
LIFVNLSVQLTQSKKKNCQKSVLKVAVSFVAFFMKSTPAVVGTLLLATSLSYANANAHEVPTDVIPAKENPARTIEATKAKANVALQHS